VLELAIGKNVRQARIERNMSQRELAGTSLSRALIGHIEHERVRPSVKTLAILAERLDKPLSYFLNTPDHDGAAYLICVRPFVDCLTEGSMKESYLRE